MMMAVTIRFKPKPFINTQHFYTLLLAVSLLLLTACTTQTSKLGDGNANVDNLHHWSIKGKFSVQVPGDRTNANLHWQQNRDLFNILLSGPLGQGAVHIVGDEHQTGLTRGGNTYYARSPRQLLLDQTHWDIPVHQFQYWVKGTPEPEQQASNIQMNESGQIRQFSQSGWNITLDRYEHIHNYHLPEKIVATHDDIKVTLIIKEWKLPESP
ncbi:lipoprotein insertase outer membrane protein LolB [Marinibactrum halimedae]|uniref:Outer-membrane lipoprotein LolB n=1 Tax=Marinibactrum halimedae TaxID=1444977 RepID=A0AA37TA31_9GAMM|nr:lipoprotein insertase outer membrane protein LolB [Marinibactrum halimedae]MCD9457450.1 lipoprotein insertase outer membrane protein LolB [Marinibactrum halimedae]GLS25497.1 outer-membrane lipoprotein LolB [Marinibactrum halimedae]